jgi:hypothetical protein
MPSISINKITNAEKFSSKWSENKQWNNWLNKKLFPYSTWVKTVILCQLYKDQDSGFFIYTDEFVFPFLTYVFYKKENIIMDMFNNNVKSILLHGFKTWKARKTIQNKVQLFVKTMT